MKHILFAALAVLVICPGAHATVLDFETDPDGNPVSFVAAGRPFLQDSYLVGDTYLPLGVSFSSEGDPVGAGFGPVFGNVFGATGNNTVVQDVRRLPGNLPTYNIRADFTDVVKTVDVDVFSNPGQLVTMTAFDAIGTPLGSVTSGALTRGTGEAMSLSGVGDISYLVWNASDPVRNLVAIDNLALDVSPVPLPAGV